MLRIVLVKYFSPTTNICIIRVARDHHRVARGGITLLDSIDGNRVVPFLIDMSGPYANQVAGTRLTDSLTRTIKHAQLSTIEHNRKVITQYRARVQTSGAIDSDGAAEAHSLFYKIGSYQDSYDEYLDTSTKEIESLRD